MIEFQAPRLSDKIWVDTLLAQGNSRGCEYNFTNLYAWKNAYHYEIAQWEQFLLARLHGSQGVSFLYPAGSAPILPALRVLEAQAADSGQPLHLVCVTAPQRQELEVVCPGCFDFEADRSGYDYLYEIDRLAELGGKRLHAKRNHINRFDQSYEGWIFEPMTPQSIPECLTMDEQWYLRSQLRDGGQEEMGAEGIALRTALADYTPLHLEGGMIRLYGEVVAFTVGDILSSDTYDVHFEKAYAELQGAYAAINREFARWVRERHPQIRYLNREDDMGVAGLRRAKESYYPDIMVEKYTARQVKRIGKEGVQ